MRIVVTGGSGFIGSAVVRLAIARGHSVLNVDKLTYAGRPENLAPVAEHPSYTFKQADVCNSEVINQIFEIFQPHAVMHLAAETHVDRSIDSPKEFFQTNVMGTFNVLEAARLYWKLNNNTEKFIFHHISTDEVFGSLPADKNVKFKEETPYDPRSPYSASKASSDHLVRAWYETYGLPVIITNCSNNYGPYHFPEKFIPVTILNAILGKPIPIYGNGSNVRDWLFVEDHADALLLVLEKGKVGRNYNIGGNNEYTNLELVKSLCATLDKIKPRNKGIYEDLITFVADRPGHDARYAIDSSRIRDELGWKPSVTIEIGLEKTIRWYLDNQDWWEPMLDIKGVGERLGTKI